MKQIPEGILPQLKVPEDPLLGLFGDEPEVLDELVEDAMRARETLPLRDHVEQGKRETCGD